jgi:hypothetical protein
MRWSDEVFEYHVDTQWHYKGMKQSSSKFPFSVGFFAYCRGTSGTRGNTHLLRQENHVMYKSWLYTKTLFQKKKIETSVCHVRKQRILGWEPFLPLLSHGTLTKSSHLPRLRVHLCSHEASRTDVPKVPSSSKVQWLYDLILREFVTAL